MAEKTIATLTNLLEVRRLLRFIRINTLKNQKTIKPMLRYIATSNINSISDKIRTKYCYEISTVSKKSMSNIKLLLHIQIMLSTHLLEHTNLHKKLQTQNKELIEDNETIKADADNAISNMSTKFKSPINIVLDDLSKRFKSKDKKILSDGEDTWGILTLDLKERLHCVLSQRDNIFYLKTYLNDLPADITDSNNIEFSSPAQAFSLINKIIQEDGL